MDLTTFTQGRLFSGLIAAFDIAVVGYLVYRVLLLIRGTRAQQVLVGLVLLAIGSFGSRAFGLRTLSWILDNFLGSFLLIVIVVFQHDIRRGLSRMGRRPFFGDISYGRGAFLVDELSRAAEALAEEGIGALIVIEREADLGELAEAGVRLDARLSSNLLLTIFTPPSPLHDGAVVIAQGRIAAASVFLPLTQNPRVDPLLGTRHRAAIGITEEVDAVAIVVSEERGQMSVVESGRITRDVDAVKLRNLLHGYLGPRPSRRKSRVA